MATDRAGSCISRPAFLARLACHRPAVGRPSASPRLRNTGKAPAVRSVSIRAGLDLATVARFIMAPCQQITKLRGQYGLESSGRARRS